MNSNLKLATENLRIRLRKIFTEYKFLLIAFAIPALMTFVLYAVWQVWPFGNHAVLVLDLNGQYVYFFEELRAMVYEGRSMLYSFGRALGGEFMGIYAYYLASPLSYIVCLFPKKFMCEAIYLILVIKAGLCGTTMAFYLYKTKKSNITGILIFSTLYALSSYAIIQAHNTMWIDELFWLPLLVYGIESVIKKRKYKLYVISLAMALLSNFYIGYMMCIFTAVYFFCCYFGTKSNNLSGEKTHFVKTLLRMALFTVIGVGIAAVIILTAYYSLQFGKTTFSTPDWALKLKYDFMDFLPKFFADSYDTVDPAGLPFVYCGILTLLLIPTYFMTHKISAREKIANGVLVLILTMSMMTTTLDLVWHGFQKPNWLNGRYSFMLCFVMIVMAFKAFEYIKEFDYKFVFTTSLIYVILLFLLQKQEYEHFGTIAVLINLALVAINLIFLYFAKKDSVGTMSLVLLVVVCVELFGNGILNIYYFDDDVVYGKRGAYVDYIEKYSPSVSYVKEYDTTKFFRMEKDGYKKKNDQLALGYYGISNSTSTLNKSVINLLAGMGYSAQSHWSLYYGGNPVSDSLLGIKYIMYQNENENYPYTLINSDTEHGIYTYMNPYALGLAYCTSSDIYDFDPEKQASPFETLNDMVTSALGSEEKIKLFKPINYEVDYSGCTSAVLSEHYRYTANSSSSSKSTVTYTITVPNSETVYCSFPAKWNKECTMYINGEKIGSALSAEKTGIFTVGKFANDETVEVKFELKKDNVYMSSKVKSYFYYLDSEVLENTLPALAENMLEITDFKSTHIEGKINVPEDRTVVFTTIPYDEGWKVYIDGEIAEISMAANSLLSINCKAGEHTVEFRYSPKCFTYGMIISIVSLLVFILICISDSIMKKKGRGIIYESEEEFDFTDIPDTEPDFIFFKQAKKSEEMMNTSAFSDIPEDIISDDSFENNDLLEENTETDNKEE